VTQLIDDSKHPLSNRRASFVWILLVLCLLFPSALLAKTTKAKPTPIAPVQQTQSGLDILDRANALYQSGHYAQAILMYRKASDRGADPVACAFNTANAYFQLGKVPESAAAYRKSIIYSNGQFTPALFNLAAALYRIGAYPECIAAYHRALRADPENTSAWLYLGEAYSRTGDKVGMQKALENAQRIDPDDISVVYQLAEVYVSMDEVDRAADLVRAGYARNPKETDFLIYLGDIYRANNRVDDASNAWREALVQQPENVELMYKLADALADSKNTFLAMDVLTKALQIKPDFSDAAVFLGNLAFESQWWDRAERAYIQAGENGNQESVQGLRNLAYEFEQKKMIPQSIAYLKTALRFAPSDANLKNEIANYEEMVKKL